MRVCVAVPEAVVSPATLEPALEATTRVDQQLIRAGLVPLARDVIAAGVRWRPEPPGDESFDHAGLVLQRGWGDCDDLATFEAASLRETGVDPGARAVVVPSGPNTWHALVRRSDGSTDDPSIEAGMPVNGYAEGVAAVSGPMGGRGRVFVGLTPTRGGWRARVDVPLSGCPSCALSVGAAGENPKLAVADAADSAFAYGVHAGAATSDLGKLQALAALAQGISQRQLIDHVDPDLLLAAVLCNNAIDRKIQLHEARYHAGGVGKKHKKKKKQHHQPQPWVPPLVHYGFSPLIYAAPVRIPSAPTWPNAELSAQIDHDAIAKTDAEQQQDAADPTIPQDALPWPAPLYQLLLTANKALLLSAAYDDYVQQHGLPPSLKQQKLADASTLATNIVADAYGRWYGGVYTTPGEVTWHALFSDVGKAIPLILAAVSAAIAIAA